MPDCRTGLIGIKLVYCDSGEKQEVWVNLNQVHALSWCDEQVGAKGKGAAGNQRLPTDPNGPGPCPPTAAAGSDLCWWNGSQWICGSE